MTNSGIAEVGEETSLSPSNVNCAIVVNRKGLMIGRLIGIIIMINVMLFVQGGTQENLNTVSTYGH